ARDLLASINGTQPSAPRVATPQPGAAQPGTQQNRYQQPAQVAHITERSYSVPTVQQQPGTPVQQVAGLPNYGQQPSNPQQAAPQQAAMPGVYSPTPVGQQPIRR
ncbi:MAG: hypothetical protein RID07_08780, partial [Lacipirellulaceae bacterium]